MKSFVFCSLILSINQNQTSIEACFLGIYPVSEQFPPNATSFYFHGEVECPLCSFWLPKILLYIGLL